MRRGIVLIMLVLAACIPRGEERRPPSRADTPARPSQSTTQCHVDLARERIEFRALPDQRFSGGCSALGAVQLLNMGTPAANLRAMTCPLARQFSRWVRESVQPAAEQWLGGNVARVETFGTYACRSVNSQPGANAVDVSGFRLGDGRLVTVQDGWNGDDERVRRFLRQVHQGGCRRFNVGLSPDSDAYHYNHLHFDMGRGPYCR
jgi:hypothetical protein